MARFITALGLLCASVLVCLGLSFLGVFIPTAGDSEDRFETAEEAVRTAACGPAGEPLDFHVRQTRHFPEAAVLLFDTRCARSGPAGASPRFAGAAVAQNLPERSVQFGGRTVWEERFWQAHTDSVFYKMQGFEGTGGPLASGPFITSDPGGGGGWAHGIGNYASASGRVLAPGRVAAVEGLLDNGSIIRSEVERDAWVLFALEAGGIREVRALDRGGEVLQRINVTSDR